MNGERILKTAGFMSRLKGTRLARLKRRKAGVETLEDQVRKTQFNPKKYSIENSAKKHQLGWVPGIDGKIEREAARVKKTRIRTGVGAGVGVGAVGYGAHQYKKTAQVFAVDGDTNTSRAITDSGEYGKEDYHKALNDAENSPANMALKKKQNGKRMLKTAGLSGWKEPAMILGGIAVGGSALGMGIGKVLSHPAFDSGENKFKKKLKDNSRTLSKTIVEKGYLNEPAEAGSVSESLRVGDYELKYDSKASEQRIMLTALDGHFITAHIDNNANVLEVIVDG